MDALRHLARPYLIAAPSGIHPSRGDGVHGTLAIRVDAAHSDQPAQIGWSAATLTAPAVAGTCVHSSHWDATTARLTLELEPGAGCQVTIRAT
jgi:hypothetical protein